MQSQNCGLYVSRPGCVATPALFSQELLLALVDQKPAMESRQWLLTPPFQLFMAWHSVPHLSPARARGLLIIVKYMTQDVTALHKSC
jgi:sulfur transfer protein SufE